MQPLDIGRGLAGDRIYDLVPDGAGHLWIATGTGLSRFDGDRFRNFDGRHGLGYSTVARLLVASTDDTLQHLALFLDCHKDGVSEGLPAIRRQRMPDGRPVVIARHLQPGSAHLSLHTGCNGWPLDGQHVDGRLSACLHRLAEGPAAIRGTRNEEAAVPSVDEVKSPVWPNSHG